MLLTNMGHITFISTIHKEIGKCNAKELYKIINKLSPEVIFLEAVDETYSEYEHYLFSTYGVFKNITTTLPFNISLYVKMDYQMLFTKKSN
jgi:hypothetical protein